MKISIALVLAISMAWGTAHAANAESIADVRCIVVAMNVSKELDPARQSAAMMIALYYLGRLDGRGSEPDVENLIAKEAAKMSAAELRAEAERCGAALTTKGNEIQRIGDRLGARVKGQVPK